MASELCPRCGDGIPSLARDHWYEPVCFRCVPLHPDELERLYNELQKAEAEADVTIESLRAELAAERAKTPQGRRVEGWLNDGAYKLGGPWDSWSDHIKATFRIARTNELQLRATLIIHDINAETTNRNETT